MIKSFKIDKLDVEIYSTRKEMGRAAAADYKQKFLEISRSHDETRMVFAAAPSQNEFLESLVSEAELPWKKVTGFHMDEYIGLPQGDSRLFQEFLGIRLFSKVDFNRVHLLSPWMENPGDECKRYSDLLESTMIDMVAMGIGENGHIAFNDPPVADFKDPDLVKIVELETACRQQQVNDGAFPTLSQVPTHAITLTIPALMGGRFLFCMVPGPTKSDAVTKTLNGPVDESCPASILRTHPGAKLYLDTDSASGVL